MNQAVVQRNHRSPQTHIHAFCCWGYIYQHQILSTLFEIYPAHQDLNNLQNHLLEKSAVKISSYLVTVDKTANKIFGKWAKFIHNRKDSRKKWLKVFNIYLLLAIWLISPIVYILHVFTYPLKYRKLKREAAYYKGV